jgi:hypothetical protein
LIFDGNAHHKADQMVQDYGELRCITRGISSGNSNRATLVYQEDIIEIWTFEGITNRPTRKREAEFQSVRNGLVVRNGGAQKWIKLFG